MKIYTDGIDNFKPWSGAVDTWNTLQEYDKIEALESVLDEIYPDGMSETELNDLIWFEPESVYEWLGLYYDKDSGIVSDTPFIECADCGKVLPCEDDRCHHEGDIYCAKCFDDYANDILDDAELCCENIG